jgi:hypothetical protein
MRIDDGRARLVGWIVLACAAAGPAIGLWLMARPPRSAAVREWLPGVLILGSPLLAALLARLAMGAHQAHANLMAEDLEAWERRATRRPGGGVSTVLPTLVFPFIYLLASPEQRRLRRYLRRR